MKKTDFQAAQEVRLARKRPPGTAVFNWSNYRKIHVWSQVLVHSTSMDGLKQMQINNNTKYIEP